MKIQILTFHYANNYGAVLQCYALSKILIDLGHDVQILNLCPTDYGATNFRGKIRNYLLSKEFVKFRNDFLPVLTKKYTNEEELSANFPKADCYIVGSDQVWNPQITKNKVDLYFFSFLPDASKRISYAASFGIDSWHYDVDKVKSLLAKFSSISVRELDGVRICSESFDISSSQVLDPTLLIDSYDDIINKSSRIKESSGIVAYKFEKDNSWYNFVDHISKGLNIKVTHINDTKIFKKGKNSLFTSVSKWIQLIQSSELVITDSYHCMVFAIIYKKQFIAMPAHKGRVSRMLSLLKDLSLDHRFISSYDDFNLEQFSTDQIDFNKVHLLIKEKKEFSVQFLKDSLKTISSR